MSLPLPAHFAAERAGEIFRVDYEERARDAMRFRRDYELAPASADEHRVGLLLVDVQNTFCIPGFELFVSGRSGLGAVDDSQRLSEFIYKNLAGITRIHATLDTHRAISIFHPIFLVDEQGRHPSPMTAIDLEDVESGRIRVNPEIADSLAGGDLESLKRHLLHYCRTLSDAGKYRLMVWPYHSMLGGIGHALAAIVEEAIFFHTVARQSQASLVTKGEDPLTESYSVLGPEVTEDADGEAIGRTEDSLLQELLAYDALVIAGQAKSHCVSWTVRDLLREIERRDPRLARKVYLLEDCTSAVVVPGVVDFTEEADASYREFESAGMHRVHSSLPMAHWPEWTGPIDPKG